MRVTACHLPQRCACQHRPCPDFIPGSLRDGPRSRCRLRDSSPHDRRQPARRQFAVLDPGRARPRAARGGPRRRAGPVRILAGAGTGKTRTITHRVAYAVATGRCSPTTSSAVTFTARAAGELRGRLRAGSAAVRASSGVQARTFHAAALRQLSYFWPRAVGGEMPALAENKFPLVSNAAGRTGLRPSSTELRDLPRRSSGPRRGWSGPTTTPLRRSRPAVSRRAPATRSPRSTPATRRLKRRNGLVDFDDLLLLTAAMVEEHESVADEVHSRYRHLRRRRVPGRQPAAAAAARRVARRPRRPVRRRRRRPDDLLVHRREPRLPAALLAALSRGDRRTAGPRLPLDAAGGRAGQPGHRRRHDAARRGEGAGRSAARRTGGVAGRARLRAGGGPLGRRAGQGAGRRRYAARRDRRALPRQRAVAGLRSRTGRERHPLPRARRRALLRPARGARGDRGAARRVSRRGVRPAARAGASRARRADRLAAGQRPGRRRGGARPVGRARRAGRRCR